MSQPLSVQMRRGLAELCVLAIVSEGETYGYEILTRLASVEGLSFSEATLYPVLIQLAEREHLTVRTEASPKGPKRRYYRLTNAGVGRLEDLKNRWGLIKTGVDILLMQERTTDDK